MQFRLHSWYGSTLILSASSVGAKYLGFKNAPADIQRPNYQLVPKNVCNDRTFLVMTNGSYFRYFISSEVWIILLNNFLQGQCSRALSKKVISDHNFSFEIFRKIAFWNSKHMIYWVLCYFNDGHGKFRPDDKSS